MRERQPGDHEIAVMDRTGDTKHLWNPNNTTEVEVAREAFKKFRKDGYLIFSVGADGEKKEQINEFDPYIGKYIATPAFKGG